MTDGTSLASGRETKAQFLLSLLPFTLFFPVGITNTGVVLFLVLLIAGGAYRERWSNMRNSPMFFPIISLLLVCIAAGIFLPRSHDFWLAFLHYQIYLFLLLFISVGNGLWQRRALQVFFVGAVYAATLFYVNTVFPLPHIAIFQNYILYAGNKSILIGIMMGLAGGWMLNEILSNPRHVVWKVLLWAYVVIALFLFAKTRTGMLIFLITCGVVVISHLRFSWRSVFVLLLLLCVTGITWFMADGFRDRMMGTYHDLKAYSQGQNVSDEGVRLEMYRITGDMIMERPISGNGIGVWEEQYPERAKGLLSERMATPHNDYLLYTAEIGLIGAAALLWIWLSQLYAAVRIGGKRGTRLFAIGVAIMFGGAVNAILRDALFGMAFMILLSICLAGIDRRDYRSSGRDVDAI